MLTQGVTNLRDDAADEMQVKRARRGGRRSHTDDRKLGRCYGFLAALRGAQKIFRFRVAQQFCEPGLDDEIGRLDEGFEADEAKARELHGASPSPSPACGRGPG